MSGYYDFPSVVYEIDMSGWGGLRRPNQRATDPIRSGMIDRFRVSFDSVYMMSERFSTHRKRNKILRSAEMFAKI